MSTEKIKQSEIVPHIPIQHRPPNKFIKNKVYCFDYGNGISGKLRIAFFRDKKKRVKSVIAQVIWDKKHDNNS